LRCVPCLIRHFSLSAPVAPQDRGKRDFSWRLLIHPEWGLWHSYRGALGLRERFDLPHRESVASPCESCRERPCLSACPVSAFAPGRPDDYVACRQYLEAGEADCLTQACGARRACPIAPEMRYSEQQASFHIGAFLDNRIG
jgi:hypothetical protein